MSKKEKIFSAIGVLLLLCMVVWTVRSVPDPPPKQEKTQEPKIMTYDGNTLKEEANGKTVWELTADLISLNADTQDAEMKDIKGKFFEQDGTVVDVKADHGSYSHGTRDVSIDTKVELKNTEGAEVSCDKLTWIAEKAMLVAEGNASVKKGDMRGTAQRIESTDGFNHVKMIGKAHLERGVKDEKKKAD